MRAYTYIDLMRSNEKNETHETTICCTCI